jgi:8-amino-7-oxononanoate synthase
VDKPFAAQQADLARLASASRRRMLNPREGIDFSSNDYLGLAGSAELSNAVSEAIARGVPVGAGGSRLLRGNHPEHEALEAEPLPFSVASGRSGFRAALPPTPRSSPPCRSVAT